MDKIRMFSAPERRRRLPPAFLPPGASGGLPCRYPDDISQPIYDWAPGISIELIPRGLQIFRHRYTKPVTSASPITGGLPI